MTLDQLIARCTTIGVRVVFAPYELAGAYIHAVKLIVIDTRQAEGHQLATLAHEYFHALRGDEGTQGKRVERLIDQRAARLLIDPFEYALAERLFEGDSAAIAEEAGFPVWVIDAYKDALEQIPTH